MMVVMTAAKPGLGDLERAVMECLWEHAGAGARVRPAHGDVAGVTVRAVHEALADRGLAYTTVLTVLDRLAKKDLVRRARDGRAWRYLPVDTREQLTARAMHSSLDDLDAGDRRAAMLHFLDTASTDEVADLRAALAALEARDGARGGVG